MTTMVAIGAFSLIMFWATWIILRIWGDYEIAPSEYYVLADVFRRYPSLGRYLGKFRHNGIITAAERRKVMTAAKTLDCTNKANATIADRKALILPLIEER